MTRLSHRVSLPLPGPGVPCHEEPARQHVYAIQPYCEFESDTLQQCIGRMANCTSRNCLNLYCQLLLELHQGTTTCTWIFRCCTLTCLSTIQYGGIVLAQFSLLVNGFTPPLKQGRIVHGLVACSWRAATKLTVLTGSTQARACLTRHTGKAVANNEVPCCSTD